MASPAPKNVFLGADQLLQYHRTVCRSGLLFDPPQEKNQGVSTNHFCSSSLRRAGPLTAEALRGGV